MLNPQRLFDRLWRARHPLRPRQSRLRQAAIACLLIVFLGIIWGYNYLTDSQRVQAMARDYLASLLGAQVHIRSASLSLTEGLRLDGVSVTVPHESGPGATLLETDTILIHYDLESLLEGRLQATQIIVLSPRVRLVEDLQTHAWNYQPLIEARQWRQSQISSGPAFLPPEVLLRDAHVEYRQMLDGREVGKPGLVDVEGRIAPSADGEAVNFGVQSRGPLALGPVMAGSLELRTGHFRADLRNVEFSPDLKAMLALPVRQWCEEHDLEGKVELHVDYLFPSDTRSAWFEVDAALQGGQLSVDPRQWTGKAQQAPIVLQDVKGTIQFTNSGIATRGLTGRVEQNWLLLSGHIDGYTPDAPAGLELRTPPGQQLVIPVDASYVDALPPAIRMIYNALKPAGHGTLLVEINRQRQGEMPRVQATVDIAHGRFTFFLFPYPARCHAGRIEIDFDPANHVEVARIENIEGSGPPAGPNAKARFTVNGAIGPFNGDAGGDFTVDGYGVRQEPALTAALPPQGRAALARLDAENARNLPQFVVNFHTRVHRNPGPVPSSGPNWDVVTDIDLTDGVGMPVDFPYLLRHATGHLRVGPDVIQIANLTARHGRGTVTINGAIRWNDKGVLPDLQVAALNLPVDAALIHAIDAKRPTNLAALNLNGRLDAIGRIFHTDSQPMAADMHLNLRDGVIPARDGTAALSQINAKMHLTPTSLEVMDLTAQHRDALILAHGAIDFSQGQAPRYTVLATADDLALDQSLYDLLPRASQRQWDAVRPEGTVNVLLTLDTRNPGAAEDQEAGATTRPGSGLQLLITPRQLSVTPQVAPYRLDHVAGAVSIAPDGVELRDISGQHGDAWINLDGRGVAGPAGMRWDVRLSGTDVPVDEQLLNATPGPLADVIRSLRLTGNIGFDFSQLSFLQTDGNARTQPIGNDADFNARVWSDAADMNVGVPLTDVKGQMTLEGTIRGGALASMIGGVKADSLKVAGRPAQDLSVLISRPPDAAILHFAKLQATLGGGQVAGDVAMSLPDSGLSRYVLSLELHDADVHQVAGTDDPKISGRISASLNLKGTWNDPSDRRGSGSVLVSDSQMYRIPLLLGMMQITNLSLPINSPFEEAAARYDVSGQEVVLEEIQIKGKDMSMEGGGHIDFDTRKVSLSLSTNNPNALNIPWVGPIWNGAQQELLRIHVDGTLQEPKISATSFDTFTTTIDHVLKGE